MAAAAHVFVQPLQGSRLVGEPRQLTRETARDINLYYWKGSHTILYDKDFSGDEELSRGGDRRQERQDHRHSRPGEKVRASILDILLDDPRHILVSHNRRDAQCSMSIASISAREENAVAQNPGDIVGWMTIMPPAAGGDEDGGLNSIMLYRASEKGAFKPLITTDYKTEVEPTFSPSTPQAIRDQQPRRDKKALVMIALPNPTSKKCCTCTPTWTLAARPTRACARNSRWRVPDGETRAQVFRCRARTLFLASAPSCPVTT